MDALFIPCWRRPEFLWHCLDNLVRTGDLSTVEVIIKPDTGSSSEIIGVVNGFRHAIPNLTIAPPPLMASNRATKQSKNVLEGYAMAAERSSGLVFMVEEDVMVARDFFRFHRALHEKEPGLFCSLSVRNTNRQVATTTNPGAYYLSHGDYCSLGVVMRKEVLTTKVLPHANRDYYRQATAYCRKHWPRSPIGGAYVEQDGLIRRIQEAQDQPTAWPHVPRAFHAGWYGYNRPKRIEGSLQQRIDLVGRTIYDPDAMLKASISPAYYADSIPQPLEVEGWEGVERIDPT